MALFAVCHHLVRILLGLMFKPCLGKKIRDCNPARMAWAENLFQKLEALCSEVEDVKWTEGLQQVEKHLQTVGNNVKKFCSDVVKDVLIPPADELEDSADDSSSVVNEAHELPKECCDNDDCGKELCNSSHLVHSCPMEPSEATKQASFLEDGADAGIVFERSDLSVEEKRLKDRELRLQVSDTSLEGKNQSMQVLPPTSNDRLESNFATNLILEDVPPLNPVNAVVDSERKGLDAELTSGDVFTGKESVRKSDFATPLSSPVVKLDESCILVDKSELYSVLHEAGRQASQKKQLEKAFDTNRIGAIQDHNHQVPLQIYPDSKCSGQQQGEGSTSSGITTSSDEFSDSEWELI